MFYFPWSSAVSRHTDLPCPPAALTWREEGICGMEDEQRGVSCLGAFVICMHICSACCTCTAWTNPLQWRKQQQLPAVSCGSCLFSYCGISLHLRIFCILKACCRSGILVVGGSEWGLGVVAFPPPCLGCCGGRAWEEKLGLIAQWICRCRAGIFLLP